jgi:5-methylcytosine-specific restriction protein A
MTAVVFRSGDKPYLAWMQEHPDGYVLNTRAEAGSRYLMLHRSGCPHIATYARSYAEDSFTAHDYVKVCAATTDDLAAWASANRPSDAALACCKTCDPGVPPPAVVPLAEEVPDAGGFLEGAVQRVLVNAYERDPRAREACLRHHGTSCAVCEFNFGSIYGPMADGFIHVHHLVPLASVGGEYKVNPVSDLRPVCPNCHAVLHLGKEPRTIEELRAILARRAEV